MPETILTPGVTTKEIDISQPTFRGIRGTPAGIIGTATQGPAFVPITFGNISDYINTFGAIKSDQFGALAARQWLNNASACTFVRVLGAGDGKQRNANGTVTNAGFFVGDETVQANGIINKNPYANHHATASIKGRTYFLGCFMSESNGSTIFSDADMQKKLIRATGSITLTATIGNFYNTVVRLTDAIGTEKRYIIQNVADSDTGNTVSLDPGNGALNHIIVGVQGKTKETAVAQLVAAINSTNGHNGTIIASDGGSGVLNLTMQSPGPHGNKKIITQNQYTDSGAVTWESFGIGSSSNFSKGSGGSIPILRGVLMAASGVVLTLSGNNLPNLADGDNRNDLPKNVSVEAAVSSLGSVDGIRGCSTGSYNMKTSQFKMIMNGFKGSAVQKDRVIKASFDMTNGDYFVNKFNKNPAKIEEYGHVLYANYDIYPDVATVTGSGVYDITSQHNEDTRKDFEDIAFLLTSSLGRDASPGSTQIPDYEDFRDRFTHAETPYVISQNYAGKPYNLFKLVSLHAGKSISDEVKCSIYNITYGGENKAASFNLIVQEKGAQTLEDGVLERHRNLSLNPASNNYIGRKIGDQNIYYDFDNTPDSQKINVEGSFPNRSRYFRVKVSNDVENKNIPIDAIPFGFRGPKHLVTSGSFLSSGSSDSYAFPITTTTNGSKVNPLLGVIEPPIPYRKNLTKGLGQNKQIITSLPWGLQASLVTDPSDPNAYNETIVSDPISGFVKHFPTHRKDTTGFSVGENQGAAKVRGQVVDSDLFNFNKFSLHHVSVVEGSDSQYNKRADPTVDAWKSAVYNRKGIPATVTSNGTTTRSFRPDDLLQAGNENYATFTFPFQGGFDGTNIFNNDKNKLDNNAVKREIDDATKQGGLKGPTVSAYRKAIDILGSKTDADIQLLTIPGQRNPVITDYAISAVENRFDALLVMDIEQRDQINAVVTGSAQNVSVNNTVTDFRNRGLDTSFAAAYFPDVNLKVSVSDIPGETTIQVPPSVALMGALGVNDLIGNTWTAPAGVHRTILKNAESLSPPITKGSLTDKLYSADINPIVSLAAYGITVWGQKTLLKNQSALDRINVRRLLIDIRRKVRSIANTLLFEPNREETLEAFSNAVNPILQDIKDQRGVKRFKVVIDTTTTTQADVENNTIRGKIFLEPTTAAEFIALDFVVSNAGAEI